MEKKETQKEIRTVAIEEYYSKDDQGTVWWHYRFNGGEWDTKMTVLPDLPLVEVKPIYKFE